jgi:hypothetical protein
MAAFNQPIFVSSDGSSSLLVRIPLAGNGLGQFNEDWLQKVLFDHPESLPIKEIDPHVGVLVPVCRELETGSGPADILYVTPTGQLVLVETKLWRSPEARRQVVAQILDYAKQLTSWKYEDLDREVAKVTKSGPGFLANLLRETVKEFDEAAFVDGVTRSLRIGDFLLLIVGDGIRSGAEALVGFLEQYGNLRFSFGLIEVAAYRMVTGGILLQPRILAKTEIIKRTIVVAEEGTASEGEPENSGEENPDAKWLEDFWGEFRKVLILDDATQPFAESPCRSTNFYFFLPPGTKKVWISAYIARSHKVGGFIWDSRRISTLRTIYLLLFMSSAVILSEKLARS